jgi:hypothetical protein
MITKRPLIQESLVRKYVIALAGAAALMTAGCVSTGPADGSYSSREYPDPSRAYRGPYYSSPFYADPFYASPYYPGGYLPYALNGYYYPRLYVPVPVYVVPGGGHGHQGGGQHDHGRRGGGGGFDGPAPKAPLGRHPDRNR